MPATFSFLKTSLEEARTGELALFYPDVIADDEETACSSWTGSWRG